MSDSYVILQFDSTAKANEFAEAVGTPELAINGRPVEALYYGTHYSHQEMENYFYNLKESGI